MLRGIVTVGDWVTLCLPSWHVDMSLGFLESVSGMDCRWVIPLLSAHLTPLSRLQSEIQPGGLEMRARILWSTRECTTSKTSTSRRGSNMVGNT